MLLNRWKMLSQEYIKDRALNKGAVRIIHAVWTKEHSASKPFGYQIILIL